MKTQNIRKYKKQISRKKIKDQKYKQLQNNKFENLDEIIKCLEKDKIPKLGHDRKQNRMITTEEDERVNILISSQNNSKT